MMNDSSSSRIVCPNCNIAFETKFCPECGQKRIDKHEFAVSHFFGHIVHEFTHLDSNKIARTFIDLITKPGRLTADYLAGKKGKYINPIRVYLTVSAVYFLFAWGALATAGGGGAQDNSTRPFVVEMAKRKNVEPAALAEKIQDKAGKYAGTLRFASVLVSGLFLMLLFRSAGRYYVEHLVFSLHFYSFDFLAKSVLSLLYLTESFTGHTTFVVGRVIYYLAAFVYLLFALRLVYGMSKLQTSVRAVAQFVFEFVLFIVVNALGFLLATLFA